MPTRNFTTKAIILSGRDYKDADKLITVFSKDLGKLTLIAKGARRTKSRKRGHLDVFNHIKLSASRSKDFNFITEVETIQNFSQIRKNLKKAATAYFLVEVIQRISQKDEINHDSYQLLLRYLKLVSSDTNLKEARNNFTTNLLQVHGFWPHKKPLKNPDYLLEQIFERPPSSIRVGKKLLQN